MNLDLDCRVRGGESSMKRGHGSLQGGAVQSFADLVKEPGFN